ncbi:ABC transporter permease [Anaerovorax sp. IOR16]|uniref:ABC transporter permease n=1 Tax=Anaerovorax sp. IOR16 TaxID=2773458 RepID=UPI0019D1AE28|nr:ABC transporter permease [Anaerovorax sp. IOR16]
MQSFFQPCLTIFRNRKILKSTTVSEVKKRYAGSVLGILWAFLYPLLFLAVYAVVYTYIFKINYNNLSTSEYIAIIFCGLVPFLGFSESINVGVSSVTANASLIKNTMFPIELVPVRTVFSMQMTHFSGTVILLVGIIAIGRFSPYAFVAIIIWMLQVMFEIGLIWILSSLNVLFRDLQNIVSLSTIMLMMLSPIAYPVEAIPDMFKSFIKVNPLFYFITANQNVLMYQTNPSSSTWTTMILLSFGFFFLGYQFFIRMKKVFVDNV